MTTALERAALNGNLIPNERGESDPGAYPPQYREIPALSTTQRAILRTLAGRRWSMTSDLARAAFGKDDKGTRERTRVELATLQRARLIERWSDGATCRYAASVAGRAAAAQGRES